MSLDCQREAADQALRDPCVQELRTVALTIRTVRWPGERLGLGTKEVLSEEPLGKFEVRQLSAREVLSSGGKLSRDDVKVYGIVGPYLKSDGVTPGGLSFDKLDPQRTWNAPDYPERVKLREVEYVLSGDIAGIYYFFNLNTDDPVLWSMILRRTRKSP